MVSVPERGARGKRLMVALLLAVAVVVAVVIVGALWVQVFHSPTLGALQQWFTSSNGAPLTAPVCPASIGPCP